MSLIGAFRRSTRVGHSSCLTVVRFNKCLNFRCSPGNQIISGSEVGEVNLWDSSQDSLIALGTKGADAHKRFDRSGVFASFDACKLDQPIVTSAVFSSSRTTKSAFLTSNLFPTLPNLDHIRNMDFSSAIIVTSDYEGTLRVFVKKSCLDLVLFEAGPEGSIHVRD